MWHHGIAGGLPPNWGVPSSRNALQRPSSTATRAAAPRRRGRLAVTWFAIASAVLSAPVAATAYGLDTAAVVSTVTGAGAAPHRTSVGTAVAAGNAARSSAGTPRTHRRATATARSKHPALRAVHPAAAKQGGAAATARASRSVPQAVAPRATTTATAASSSLAGATVPAVGSLAGPATPLGAPVGQPAAALGSARAASGASAAAVNSTGSAAATTGASTASPAGPGTPAAPAATASAISAARGFGAPLYVDPRIEDTAAGTPLSSLGAEDQDALRTIAAQPTAHWLVGSGAVTADVAKVVGEAAQQGAIATFVAYNIPYRDCGSFSGNAPQSADQYRRWIRDIVDGLGGRRAIMIVEPDALALAGCLSSAEQAERFGLLRYAIDAFAQQGSYTYLDAGNSAWLSVQTAASLLQQAGIDRATGFSLNVSQYRTDAESISYGNRLSAAVGGKHYIVDSSRNGVAPASTDWCNPPGKGLGHRPTTTTGAPLLDALLWVKTPGQSDGQCSGGPAAGSWFPSYARMLVSNAAS